jgi:hypothetical protein
MNEELNYETFIPSRSKSPEIVKKPKRGNFILRQELNSYNPECNPKCGIIVNTFFTLLFLTIGAPIVYLSKKTIEFKLPYTDCSKKISNSDGKFCQLIINVNVTMPAPVFFYYELDNFYLNHRDIVKSKSWSQLRGEINTV